jgi:general secretion pathway protein D
VSFFNRLIVIVLTLGALALGPIAPLQAQTKKGDKFLAEARVHAAKKEWDAALECYEKARSEDPNNPVYQIAADIGHAQAAQAYVEKGITSRSQGQLGDALTAFEKAYSIYPGSAIALQELADTRQMILRERKRVEETGKEAPPDVRAMTPGQAAEQEELDRISRMRPVPELHPTIPGTINLKMTAKTKTIFETLGKYAGINVIWDSGYTAPAHDIFTVEFSNTTLDRALDYISALSQSQWRRLSPSSIYVANGLPR